jgi:mRNA interferase MazF
VSSTGSRKPGGRDPKKARVFVVVSRGALIDSRFPTVVCAPVYTWSEGLATQVDVGDEEGLRHPSSIHCDALLSVSKSDLTDFVGILSGPRLAALNRALRFALAIE